MLREKIGCRPAQRLARLLAERVGADPGAEGDHPIAVDRKQHDRGTVDDRPHAGVALAELALHLETLLELVSKHGLLAVELGARRSGCPQARAAAARHPGEQAANHGWTAERPASIPGITRGRAGPGYGRVTVGRRPSP